jgi:hypothetical protein
MAQEKWRERERAKISIPDGFHSPYGAHFEIESIE